VAVTDPKILKRGGAKDNLSAPSSFIANVHNEIYAFYTEKATFWQKIWANRRGGRPPLNPPLQWLILFHQKKKLKTSPPPLFRTKLQTICRTNAHLLTQI